MSVHALMGASFSDEDIGVLVRLFQNAHRKFHRFSLGLRLLSRVDAVSLILTFNVSAGFYKCRRFRAVPRFFKPL